MIEGYKIGRKLGEGTFGAVHEATSPDGETIALKTSLRPLSDASTKEAMLLQNEIEAMRRLEHPSLVAVRDAGFTSDGRVYIAMELVGGEGLEQYLDQRDYLDAVEALRITAAIASAVAACHDLDILHLDLKPHNVILTDPHTSAIKVLDFGLAHVTSAWRTGREASGTPFYMSPERFEAAPPDVRDDLYAIGVILYELLTGEPPFIGESLTAIYAAKRTGIYDPATELVDGIPDRANALIEALLSPEREARPTSATQVANELSELAFEALAGFSDVGPTRPIELAKAPGQLPFIGRERELTQMLVSFNQSGFGRGLTIAGEAGLGKSRLLAQFLDEIGEVSTGYGRCRELHNALPYSPWREAIGRLAEANPEVIEGIAASLEPYAALLLRLVPELGESFCVGCDPSEEDGTPVAVAIAALLEKIGALQPSVLVIEDLHWADAGSRAVIDYLGTRRLPDGMMIVTTTRESLDSPMGFELIQLEPLVQTEGDELIALGIGTRGKDGSDTHGVIEKLKRRVPLLATGNPLITVQVLRHLETTRCLVREGGELKIRPDRLSRYQPPDCIRGVVAASVAELSAETRRVLGIGALLGRSFRCTDLYELEVHQPATIKTAFTEALAAEVLSRSECGSAAVFVHETIREELAAAVDPHRQRQLHRRIGELLAKRGSSAAEVAHHHGLGGDTLAAAAAHIEAGREARGLNAPIDAADHFESATANALRSLPSPNRDQLLSAATFELVAAGSQLGNTDATLAHLDRCAAAITAPSLEAKIALEAGYARAFYVRGQFEQAAIHGNECLALAAGDRRFASYTLIPLALSGRAMTASGRFGPASAVLSTVAELAETQGEWTELAHSTGVRGIALAYAGKFREAHDCIDRALDIAHQTGDPIRRLAGLFYRTVVAEAAYDLELGLAASTSALRFAREHDIGGIYLYLTTLFAGRQQFHAGHFERAKLLLTRALDSSDRLEISMGRGWNYAFLGDAFFARGELTAARRCYESAIELSHKGAGDEYAGPAGLIGVAHCISRYKGSDREIDSFAKLAQRRSRAAGNVSFEATVLDRLSEIWAERKRVDRQVQAESQARQAFVELRVNRRAWMPKEDADTPHRRRRSPSRHPTLIGAAAAPA